MNRYEIDAFISKVLMRVCSYIYRCCEVLLLYIERELNLLFINQLVNGEQNTTIIFLPTS